MVSAHPGSQPSGRLLSLSAKLNRAETVEAAVARAARLADIAFEQPMVNVYECDTEQNTFTIIGSSAKGLDRTDGESGELLELVAERASESTDQQSPETIPEAIVEPSPQGSVQGEAFVPISHNQVLHFGTTEPGGFDEEDVTIIEGIAANLETALTRLNGQEVEQRKATDQAEDDATALRRLNELTVNADGSNNTIERLLTLGCEHFGLNTGILSRVDAGEYKIKSVVDSTGVHETDAVYGLGETMCETTLAGDRTEPLAFADVSDTDHRNHSAAESVSAYIAAPVVVSGETYGTVNFSMAQPRSESFRPTEREFVTRIAEWIGREIERRRRVNQLEQYETILEAVDDPVYALDTDGRFTFVNAAAEREFGYGEEVIGEHVSIGIDEADIERIEGQIEELLGTDEQSTTAEFELQTGDGERRTVENRLTLIGDGEFQGTAGVLRDITARQKRERELEQYKTVAQTASDVIITVGTDSVVQNVNPAVSDVFGYKPEELIGGPLTALMPERMKDAHAAGIGRYLSTGERTIDWDFIELPGCRADGVEIPLGVSFSEYEFEGERYFTGIIRDISEQEERENDLQSFQQAVEEAADGVAVLEDGEYVYVDQTHIEMYGFDTKNDLLGETWQKLYDDDEVARLKEVVFPALETDGHWRGMVTGSRPDGSTFPAELSLTIIEDGRLVCTVRDETERQAREQELELKERAMDEATVGIQITDPTQEHNPLVYVNDGFERMTGYMSEEALGRNPRFLQGAESDPEQVARLREAIDTEEPVSVELKNYRKDGTPYWARLSITPVTDEDGTVRNYVGIQQNVTEQRKRQRETEKRVGLLERMYEVTTDPETRFEAKITALLEAGCDYLDLSNGYLSRVDMDGDPAPRINITDTVGSHELLQPGKSGPLSESYCRWTPNHEGTMALTDAAESELIPDVAYETFGLDTYVGGKVVTSDGLHGTLCFASSESRNASFGQFERSLVSLLGRWIGYEIERHDAREELQQQQEQLELTLSGTNTGITEWDLETDELNSDDTFVDLVGQDVDTAEEYFESVIHPDDRERVQETLEANLAAREPTKTEYRAQTDDEDSPWLQSRAVPTYDDDGNPDSVLAIVTDISDRKAEGRERRRNERRFESLFEDPEMLVGLLDTEGTLLDANTKATEYIDVSAGNIQGEPLWETAWWNHSDALQDDLREWIGRAADGEYVEYSAPHQTAGGDRFYVDGTIRPVTDADGAVTSLLVSARDVTEREQQRKELQDRQRKLDLVLSNTGTSVAEIDITQGIVRWDETPGENEIGSPETLTEFFETVHIEDRERVRSAVEAMADGDEPISIEFRFVDEDDSVAWVAAEAVPVMDASGDPTGEIVGIATDITARKEREQALEDSQQRYETLLSAAPDPVFVADAETGEIVEANAAAEEMRGQSREELVGMDQAELHPQHDFELYRDAFTQSVGDSTLVSELPDGTQPKLCSSDGETVPVEINAAPVQLPNGPALYGVFRDISERRERERELELKERAMNEANVGITINDPNREDGPLIYVNDGFVDQTGYAREDALGRNCRFLQAGDRDQQALDDLRDAIEAEESTTVELRNYRKDGEQFWNRLSVTPVYNESGTLANYIGVQQDVTDEKTREQRMQALHGTTRKLLEADDEDEAVAKALDTLTGEFDFHRAGVYLREGDELVQAEATGQTPDAAPNRIERGQTPMWDAMESGESVVIEEYGSRNDGIKRGNVSKGLYIPVGEQGVFFVGAVDGDRLDASEQQLVEVLAGNLASVLDTLARRRELFEEREQFRLLTESVDEYAFLTVDDDGAIQTWNPGAETLFGYDADTALDMSIGELHSESERETELHERLLQQARIAGESADEGWRVRADGSRFYADVRYAPLESDDGKFRGYATVVRDMTERRRQQRRTERFVEEANDVVTIVGTDGTVEYASGSADRILGYDPDDMVGENLFDYFHPESRQEAMETFFDGTEDPDSDLQTECRVKSGDGEWLNIEVQCRNMLDDDAVDGMLLYLRDVTEQRERARRFESIFNQTFQFTGLLEPNGMLVEANDAALEFGGFERDEIVGTRLYDVPWFTHSQSVRADARNAIKQAVSGEFVRYETEVRGDDGLATIDFSVKPVTDDNNDVSLLVVEGRDITARQQQRRHLEVMQRVMRHNMRNDLTKMRGWTQMITQEEDAEKRAEKFETIEQILNKWEAMIEKMKDIRHVIQSEGTRRSGKEPDTLLENAVSPVREEHDDATISIEAIDAGTVQTPERLTDAIRELVKNAVDVREDATVAVELSRPGDNWIEIDIRDDGPGMPEIEADVLETGEESPLSHGRGLGLWMVRTIVTQAGGDVSVEATADGTTVRLRLPSGAR